jgi:Tetracyclin repressor-like, C-terminal domain
VHVLPLGSCGGADRKYRRTVAPVAKAWLKTGPDVEERAEAAGYRLARRSLRGNLVWRWQPVADPDDGSSAVLLERQSGPLLHGARARPPHGRAVTESVIGCSRSRRNRRTSLAVAVLWTKPFSTRRWGSSSTRAIGASPSRGSQPAPESADPPSTADGPRSPQSSALVQSDRLTLPAPDTGSLRNDLIGVQRHQVERMNAPDARRVTAGLIADLADDPELADIYVNQFLAPRRATVWEVLSRAVDRGELDATSTSPSFTTCSSGRSSCELSSGDSS